MNDRIDEEELFGPDLAPEIGHIAKRLVVDSRKTTNVSITGPWGAGKTRVADELIKKLEIEFEESGFESSKILVFRFDLLPFGNISESVTAILSEIAARLWDEGIINIKYEMRSIISDTTPEINTQIAFSLGPFSISRDVSYSSSSKHNRDALARKLQLVVDKGYRLVIMLDDLDRLKPSEITIVLRMVERLQELPGLLIILPYYREVVASALVEDLSLADSSASHAYLRRFKGESIYLSYSLDEYRQRFEATFKEKHAASLNKTAKHFDIPFEKLAWYVFVHHLVLAEVFDRIGEEPDANKIAKYFPNVDASSYLSKLWEDLVQNARFRSRGLDIDAYAIEDNDVLKTFSEVYPWLKEGGNASGQLQNLTSLINKDLLLKPVYQLPENLKKDLKDGKVLRFDQNEVSKLPTRQVFHHILLPLLRKTENESMITKYYTMRDMKQLASQIAKDKDMSALVDDPGSCLDSLIKVTKQKIIEFR